MVPLSVFTAYLRPQPGVPLPVTVLWSDVWAQGLLSVSDHEPSFYSGVHQVVGSRVAAFLDFHPRRIAAATRLPGMFVLVQLRHNYGK